MTFINEPLEQCPCDHEHLTVVYKGTGKSIPQKLYKQIVDNMSQEEAQAKFEILCRNCQRIKKAHERELQRNNR
jgi:hypothetical protein